MICRTILDAMGNTPLIQLNRMVSPNSARVLVKFEGLNIGGSIKTRTAWNMILDAERRGIINKDSIIVEPTSGNQGIGLALV
ncbi:MAG: pyridoxal-phosphate dependent enzyme, partial [Spirochaetia bacterium]|nr:pyridoxal-phosphate dependent enzyme [Spirochaetia bacterium]